MRRRFKRSSRGVSRKRAYNKFRSKRRSSRSKRRVRSKRRSNRARTPVIGYRL